MLINKTIIILIIVLCIVSGISGISIPQNPEKEKLVEKSKYLFNFSEIKLIWDEIAQKYIHFVKIDLFMPVAAVLAGTFIVVGIDFFLKRRTNNVIKRISSFIKDK